MSQEEREERQQKRKARRRELVARVKSFGKAKVRHALRPPDEGDIEAAVALGTALIVGAKDGYTDKEWAELDELWENLKEERADTP